MEGFVKDISGDVHESDDIRDIVGREKVRELMRRSDAWGLLFLFGHFVTMAVTVYLLFLSLGTWWVIPATVLHGFIIACLFAPYHECGHNTPFKSRWLNNAVYLLTGLILLQLPLKFRYEHADHHTYTQEEGRDPHILSIGEKLGGWFYYASSIPHFKGHFLNLLRIPFGIMTEFEKQSTPESARPTLQRQAWLFWAAYIAIAAISIWFQSWVAAIYWLIPRFAGEPLEKIIRMAEHVGCSYNGNIFENTRTLYTWAPIRWLCWNMPYHVEHHAIPLVPFYKLPELHKILRDHEKVISKGYAVTAARQIRGALRNSAATREEAAA